jgi:voltage-gated potassium channel
MYLFTIILSFLKDKEYLQLLGITAIILAIGTISYHFIEGWTWIDALYFSIITLITIGYGDFSPQTTAAKLFTIGYIVVGVGMILGFINTVFHHYKSQREKTK